MKFVSSTFILIFALTFSVESSAFSVERELAKMVGFTIVASDTVEEIYEKDYNEKYLKLHNGSVFKVEFMYLDPLVFTEVIVFAKPPSDTIRLKYQDKLPEHMLFTYKLLIDREMYDASPE